MTERLHLRDHNLVALLILAMLGTAACQTMFYKAAEKAGYHKREILVDRVAKARDAQDAAKQEFASAFEQFTSVVAVDGGALEKTYSKLQKTYDRSESKAKAVRDRIDSVDHVAGALFKEWEGEIEQYQSADLKASSTRQLKDTRARYGELLGAMKRAEQKMDPVLLAFRDQVLCSQAQPERQGDRRDSGRGPQGRDRRRGADQRDGGLDLRGQRVHPDDGVRLEAARESPQAGAQRNAPDPARTRRAPLRP